MLARYIEKWWVILLRGLSAIVLGLLTFFWPAITLTIIIYFIAFYLIIELTVLLPPIPDSPTAVRSNGGDG
jgi:uncharacterized membrane protein HdeD (DUF308 family)